MRRPAQGFESVPIERVREFWDRRPCNIRHSPKPVGTREYFDEVEARKYFVEPHIPVFAEFPRWRGKRVLEIGCGIGTDTINFARHGALVTAVELSEKSLEIAKKRAEVYGLQDRIRFFWGDAENLTQFVPVEPYDLIYSFGVIHHTPRPERAVNQMRYYAQPGSLGVGTTINVTSDASTAAPRSLVAVSRPLAACNRSARPGSNTGGRPLLRASTFRASTSTPIT